MEVSGGRPLVVAFDPVMQEFSEGMLWILVNGRVCFILLASAAPYVDRTVINVEVTREFGGEHYGDRVIRSVPPHPTARVVEIWVRIYVKWPLKVI